MASITLTFDPVLLAGPLPITSVENAMINAIYAAGKDYQRQFNSTDIEDAYKDYVQGLDEGRGKPMGKQIKDFAADLLLKTGVALAGGKFVACSANNMQTLTLAGTSSNAVLATMSLDALDGGKWPINTTNRAATALGLLTARITAVNGVRDSSITAFQALDQAGKRAFQFSSIVWP